MTSDKKVSGTLSLVWKLGAIIVGAVASLVFFPPVIDASENVGVNWKKITVFIAGIITVLVYKFFKAKNVKSFAIGLIITLIILFITYQIVCQQNTVQCFGKVSVVISHKPVMLSKTSSYENWKRISDHPEKEMIESNYCSSKDLWNLNDLLPVYYGLILLYFLIILNVVLLLTVMSDILFPPNTKITNL